jgi:tRNA(Arg) A34 adenosine deaminase TadA
MRQAIDEAKNASAAGNRRIGCVIVNEKGLIVAKGSDCSHSEHRLRHAAVVCIDKVAALQKQQLSTSSTTFNSLLLRNSINFTF